MARRSESPVVELITCHEADERFRLPRHEAIKACRAGLVKCRPCIARGGKPSFKIDLQDARRLWGAQ